MTNICLSSEIYKIDIKDLLTLEDSSLSPGFFLRNKIAVLMGDLDKNIPDTLLCGRKLLEQYKESGAEYVPVRIAFVSKIKKYDIITPFVKKMRGKYKVWSSNVYHISPLEIRRLKIERSFRSKDNAYTFSNPLYRYSGKERKKRYETLLNSMKNGYDDNYPIEIMLARMLSVKDTVNNGHHRLGTALECGLPKIAARFSAAGQAPRILYPILKIIADISMHFKQKAS
ncbi:MAG: hypothetical protein IJ689_07745 [Alphaproteobacteria bacterium]|nr:hypothetical protein [Alphaproteobacteria bacterium]MBR1649468.1 hypothetical protein [Alphaproteobacteria bacterium]